MDFKQFIGSMQGDIGGMGQDDDSSSQQGQGVIPDGDGDSDNDSSGGGTSSNASSRTAGFADGGSVDGDDQDQGSGQDTPQQAPDADAPSQDGGVIPDGQQQGQADGGDQDQGQAPEMGSDDWQNELARAVARGVAFGKQKHGIDDHAMPSPEQMPNVMSYIRGDGAVHPNDMMGAEQAVDPKGEMDEKTRHEKTLVKLHDFYGDQGPEAVHSALQYDRKVSDLYSSHATVALDKGHAEAAANSATAAYENVPDGGRIEFRPAGAGPGSAGDYGSVGPPSGRSREQVQGDMDALDTRKTALDKSVHPGSAFEQSQSRQIAQKRGALDAEMGQAGATPTEAPPEPATAPPGREQQKIPENMLPHNVLKGTLSRVGQGMYDMFVNGKKAATVSADQLKQAVKAPFDSKLRGAPINNITQGVQGPITNPTGSNQGAQGGGANAGTRQSAGITNVNQTPYDRYGRPAPERRPDGSVRTDTNGQPVYHRSVEGPNRLDPDYVNPLGPTGGRRQAGTGSPAQRRDDRVAARQAASLGKQDAITARDKSKQEEINKRSLAGRENKNSLQHDRLVNEWAKRIFDNEPAVDKDGKTIPTLERMRRARQQAEQAFAAQNGGGGAPQQPAPREGAIARSANGPPLTYKGGKWVPLKE